MSSLQDAIKNIGKPKVDPMVKEIIEHELFIENLAYGSEPVNPEQTKTERDYSAQDMAWSLINTARRLRGTEADDAEIMKTVKELMTLIHKNLTDQGIKV